MVQQQTLDAHAVAFEQRLWDVAAERRFLACLFRRPSLIYEAERLVPPTALQLTDHRYIYEIMLGMYRMCARHGWELVFDHVAMLSVARSLGRVHEERFIQRTDGMEKVRQIEAFAVSVDVQQFVVYAEIINDRAARIAVLRKAVGVIKDTQDFTKMPDAAMVAAKAESDFASISQSAAIDPQTRITKLSDQMALTLPRMQIQFTYPMKPLFFTPVPQFPTLMKFAGGGFRRGGLSVLVARPKTGKTTALLNIALSVASMGWPALFMDNEMTREEIYTRELAHISGHREADIVSGALLADGATWSEVEMAMRAVENLPVYYVNIAQRPPSFIHAIMRQFKNNFVGTESLVNPYDGKQYTFARPCAVLYDWIKLPDASSLGPNMAEWQSIGFLASALKDAATQLDMPVIAGAQANRAATGKVAEQYEVEADSFVGQTDRINQFSTMVMHLRDIDDSEAEALAGGFAPREGREGSSALAFNQVLHITLNRHGAKCKRGIPLHHDFGRFHYADLGGSQEISEFREKLRKSRQTSGGAQRRQARFSRAAGLRHAASPSLPVPA